MVIALVRGIHYGSYVLILYTRRVYMIVLFLLLPNYEDAQVCCIDAVM